MYRLYSAFIAAYLFVLFGAWQPLVPNHLYGALFHILYSTEERKSKYHLKKELKYGRIIEILYIFIGFQTAKQSTNKLWYSL